MKIDKKIDFNPTEKLAGVKTQVKSSRPKTEKKSSRLHPKDKSALGREKDEKSARKLGIVKEATAAQRTAKPKKNWTVLCYFAVSDLEEAAAMDLLELERAQVGESINVITQIARGKEPNLKLGGKPGMVRYKVEPFQLKPGDLKEFSRYNPPTLRQIQKKHRKISSPELKDLGSANPHHPDNLQEFISFGMKEYPANNYLIKIFAHGGGVDGFVTSLKNFKQLMKNAETQAGVDKNQVVLDLKSCQMAQVETACEFHDIARTMLASQATTPGFHALSRVLNHEEASEYGPDKMSGELFKQGTKPFEYESALLHHSLTDISVTPPTLSLTDLRQMPEVKKRVQKLIKAIKSSRVSPVIIKRNLLIKSRPSYFNSTGSCRKISDLSDIARQIIIDPEIKDPALKKAATELDAALGKAIIGAYRRDNLEHGYNSYGLGVFTPSRPAFNHDYQELDFDRATGWSKFMASYAPELNWRTTVPGSPEPVIRFPELKQASQLAEKALQDFPRLADEIDKAANEAKALDNAPQLGALGKLFLKQKKTGKVNLLWQLCHLMEKAPKPEVEFLEICLQQLIKKPEPDGYRAVLTVMAALDGEISSRTLAQAAQNLKKINDYSVIEQKAELLDIGPQGLETKERGLEKALSQESENYHLISDLIGDETYGSWVEKFYNRLADKSVGEELLTNLALASRNLALINLKNYEKNNLENLSWLESGGRPPIVERALQLPDKVVKTSQWKEIAKTAQQGLNNFEAVIKELKPLAKQIQANPQSTVKNYHKIRDLDILKRLQKINREVKSPSQQKIMDAALTVLIRKSAERPAFSENCLKAGLTVFSALKGEVSSKTLAAAANKLLNNADRNYSGYTQLEMGEKLIFILGKLSGNRRIEKIIDNDGEYNGAEQFLKKISRLNGANNEN